MITFFDTETTGLPKDWKAPMSQLDNWPRVIELGWLVADFKGQIIKEKTILIKPDQWVVPVETFWIEHGFSTEQCEAEGIPMPEVLAEFVEDLNQCEYLVSHNMDYDHKVLGAEFLRYDVKGKQLTKICTKDASTDWCKIPFEGQRAYMSRVQKRYKWPKLSELHMKLFGVPFDGAHSAGGDVRALMACFFELVKIGVIPMDERFYAS